MQGLWVILVVAIVVGLLAYYSYLQEQKRREALARLAGELGWRFDPSKDWSHDEEYAHFEIFRRGHSRCAFNTLAGTLDWDGRACAAKMGDFRYKVTSGSGKSRRTQTYRFSYLIVHLPFRHAPSLLVRREGLFDKIAGAFGWDDIDFESAEFSRQFHVNSTDKRFAWDMIHPRMMEFLLASDPPTIDLEHGRCCLCDGRRRWSDEEFRRMLDWSRRFLELWPDHVKADLKSA